MINFYPFCGPGEFDLVALVMKMSLYVPIGYFLACRVERGRHPLVVAVVGGVLFSAGVEPLQVLVASRISTVTDVLLGTVGAVAGGMDHGTHCIRAGRLWGVVEEVGYRIQVTSRSRVAVADDYPAVEET